MKWTEQDVIDAFEAAVLEAESMPSPQQMVQQLLSEAQMAEQEQGMVTQ